MDSVVRVEAMMDSVDFAVEPLTEWSGDDARRNALEQGYLFVRGLVERKSVIRLRDSALAAADELGWLADDSPPSRGIARPGIRLGVYDAPDWIQFQQRVLPMPEFISLGEHPAILSILKDVYQDSVMTRRGDICRVTSPNTPELTTVPHQDHFYVRGSDRVWTAWIPLGDCPRDLGGLAVLPGSHRSGPIAHHGRGSGRQGISLPDRVWATADYAAGDVLLFNCLTIHRALPNQTGDRIRVSADYRYQPASVPI